MKAEVSLFLLLHWEAERQGRENLNEKNKEETTTFVASSEINALGTINVLTEILKNKQIKET